MPGRVTSASSTRTVSTRDPRVQPSERVAARVAAAHWNIAAGGFAEFSDSVCGGARFTGASSVGTTPGSSITGPNADARPGWSFACRGEHCHRDNASHVSMLAANPCCLLRCCADSLLSSALVGTSLVGNQPRDFTPLGASFRRSPPPHLSGCPFHG